MKHFTSMWQSGKLTNAEYLLVLNFAASRSFNDPTQYPVFPWVLTDYKNENGLRASSMTLRDLKKPVGSLSDDKYEQFKSKYFEMVAKDPKSSPFLKGVPASGASSSDSRPNDQYEEEVEPAYMYFAHYSTPGIVFYYLIRKYPSYLVRIQNEAFGGPPDRIFHDVNITW